MKTVLNIFITTPGTLAWLSLTVKPILATPGCTITSTSLPRQKMFLPIKHPLYLTKTGYGPYSRRYKVSLTLLFHLVLILCTVSHTFIGFRQELFLLEVWTGQTSTPSTTIGDAPPACTLPKTGPKRSPLYLYITSLATTHSTKAQLTKAN